MSRIPSISLLWHLNIRKSCLYCFEDKFGFIMQKGVLQQFKQMRIARKTSTQSHNNSDTCQSIRLDAPSKIIQTNIKLTYHHLKSLPIVTHCNHVTHLYLSHNQIATLKGIQSYPLLVSLNISYNCLEKIGELRRIVHPEKMDKINLRMNQFQYGYEDEVVRMFPNLRKLEGEKIGERKVKQELARMRDFISQQMIDFYWKTEDIIEAMNCDQDDKENMDTNKPIHSKTKTISTEFMNNIFFSKLKDAYIHPSQELLRRKNTYFLVNICFTFLETLSITDIYTCKRKKKDDYMEATRKAYRQICNAILLKFSSRNDKTLINYLEAIKAQGESITSCFARLGNFQESKAEMIKTHSMEANPSKYMKKIQKGELIDHPMNRLANWQVPQYRTLIPFEQTKWHHFHNQPSQQQEEALHQHIPIFIYCKEYIEVIADVILNQVGKILNLEHQILRTNLASSQRQAMSDEIQLNLSNSEVMSFGQKQQDHQQAFQQHFSSNLQAQRATLKVEPRSNSFLFNPPEQLIHNPTRRKQQKISMNIDKYSIYQINLIFKSFRTLKINLKQQKSNKPF